ncbi:MAG: Gfo/Idh/MocA family oxidoreductase [Candidatus Marinimicrobia bacterium]|nr:Gfo/Idh/MocA family oxidoreductase [Candidatus Neomarinimicrobiota bacterium]
MTQLQWGLIGTGDIAEKRVAPALRELPECDLVAINRKRNELAQEFADEFGADRWYETWEELLADDTLDAVYIATPVNLHAPITIAAAEAGKHILCEKPMALNTEECNAMIDAAEENGVKLGVAYYRHFYPILDRIKGLIAEGEIGHPVYAHVNAFEYFDRKPGEPRAWLLDKTQSGGGPMWDFGCHRIEVFQHLFGQLEETTGLLDTLVFDREVEDTGTAIFRCESGTMAVLNVTHAASEPQDTLDIYGTRGSIHVPVLNGKSLEVKTTERVWTEEHPPHPNVHWPLIKQFTEAVLNDEEPVVGGDLGKAVNVALADLMS